MDEAAVTKVVGRKEDMSPDGRLRIYQQDDGDVIVEVLNFYDGNGSPLTTGDGEPTMERASVEFCAYSGGGKSDHTRQALVAVMEAMEKDNAEQPNWCDPALDQG